MSPRKIPHLFTIFEWGNTTSSKVRDRISLDLDGPIIYILDLGIMKSEIVLPHPSLLKVPGTKTIPWQPHFAGLQLRLVEDLIWQFHIDVELEGREYHALCSP